MELNRREYLLLQGAGLAGNLFSAEPAESWTQKIRRVGQINMTEHDPVDLNVEEWANYWASLKVDALLVSVTGIVAFYPTQLEYFRRAKYLGDRDFFGDCCAAAKKRGIHVIARMSPDLTWEEFIKPKPEWFQRDANGQPGRHTEDPRLFRTCMFSSYFTEHIPSIMREVNSRYDVDSIFTNGWPPLGRFTQCYCEQCKKLPRADTVDYWDKFNERAVYLWKLYDSIAKEKRPGNIFFGNLGGGIRSTTNLKQLGDVCNWFNCDNQGRGGDDTPIWGASQQGRVCWAVMKGRTSTNVTASWSTGAIRWRNAAKDPAEAKMWMDETIASGMVPWYHFIGGEKGLGEDRRWQEPGHQYFTWLARHDEHFVNRRSLSNLGVVMGQRTHLFHAAPPGETISQHIDGLYYALLEGRFCFDFVHEDDLGEANLRQYSALILPNTAWLSDEQCHQLQEYVARGGSLLATYETSLYTERGKPRPNFGLAEVFGIQKAGEVIGTVGNAFYARIERPHEILTGFTNTNWIPGAEHRLPVRAVASPVLTVVPGYPAYPPELSYPSKSNTDEPAVVLREQGNSRLVYFPGDIDRTLWRSGHTDLSRLIRNSVRWVLRGRSPVTISGPGIVEAFFWETKAGFALHLLNYTNPAMHRGWIREFYPVGEQRVSMTLPAGKRVKRVELLRAEKSIPFVQRGDVVEFRIPAILDYEAAAIV